jgi:4-hydroxy-4-methyl-2-oxoglutarate aldolase
MISEDGIFIGDMTRPDPDLIRRLALCHPASFANPGSLGASIVLAGGAIKPLAPTMRVAGPAVTVKLDHIDHYTALAAATVAQPGDVVLIAAGGGTDIAIWGHGLCLAAQASKLAGIVIDGAVVNKAELLEMGMPTFARGASPATGGWDGDGQINVPVEIDGLTIYPGDILLGDADGVVVIRAAILQSTIEGVEAKEGEDARRRQRLSEGEPLLDIVRESRR